MTQTVLFAGATGMLGSQIARHLLDRPEARLRLLVRGGEAPNKRAALDPLLARGAEIVEGNLTDRAALDRATQGADVIVSAVQGGPDVIILQNDRYPDLKLETFAQFAAQTVPRTVAAWPFTPTKAVAHAAGAGATPNTQGEFVMSTDSPAAFPPIPGSEPLIRNVEAAPAYWLVDVLWIVLADGNDTGGRFSLMEQLLPKGSGPGPHKHTWSDETFYMLDGEITLLVGDEIRTARKGDFVVVPRSTRHAFRVESETARFLNGHTPASMEALIVELATPATERTLPPEGAVAPPRMNPDLLRRYGMDVLPGPDPLRPDGR
jgi:quercetin dioxygenase-like cupin family protein